MTRVFMLLDAVVLVLLLTDSVGATEDLTQKAEDAKRKALWAALMKAIPKDVREIDAYGENPSLTEVCFSADRRVYFFDLKEGKVRQLIFMKVLPKINRITFREDKTGAGLDSFVLWAYGNLEMVFSASK